MEYIAPVSYLVGATLLTIGFISDSAAGTKDYSDDNQELKPADAAFADFTVADLRKTTGTSMTLKTLGAIALIVGAAFQTYDVVKGKKSSTV